MIVEYFKLGIKNLRRRRLRSWLTMIGIFIAIATIFVLISLSLGLQYAIQEQFRQLGTDKFFIIPGKGITGPPGSTIGVELTTDDVDVIKRVSGIRQVTYYVAGNGKIEYLEKIRYRYIFGIEPEGLDLFFETGSMKIQEGRSLERSDINKVVLGIDYKEGNLFDRPVEVGTTIKINDRDFKVIGIMARIGNPDDDKNVFMPVDDTRSLFNITKRADYIIVQINPGENLQEVADRVEKKLRNFRDVTEKTQDFSILTPEEILRSFNNILNILTSFLIGIAAISLLVGGVGIATTMYTSVLERVREIGVMKAVGARNSDILQIFLIESGLLGLVGGAIGVLIGMFVAKSIEFIAANQLNTTLLQVVFPPYLIVGCLAFAFLIGAFSGIFPAWRASKIKPVEALRYE